MIETLIVIGGVIGAAVVGLFVFTRDVKRWSNRIYGLMTLSFVTLMVANLFTFGMLDDASVVLWCIRTVAAATTLALTCLYCLTQVLAVESGTQHMGKKFNLAVFCVSLVIVALDFTPLVFKGVFFTGDGSLFVTVAWGIALFIVHAITLMVVTVAHLLSGLRKGTKRRRGQDISILIGVAPALILAPITGFILPVVYGLTWFVALTPFYIVFFIVMVAYAMIRHGLFDIRLAAVRTAAYVLTLLTLAAAYIVIVYLVSSLILRNQASETAILLSPIAIGAALLIAFIFQPIKRLFNRLTDKLFYKDNYSISQFIAHLNQTLNSTNDLRLLLERTSEVIASTLKTKQAFFFVHLLEGHYMTAGTAKHARLAPAEFEDHTELIKSLDIILASQLEARHPLRRMMASHRVELLMPLRKSGLLVGYLCLGEPRNIGYTSRDLRALKTIADELTIAIQNSLSVEEVRKLNDTLEQRISSATKELRASNSQLQRLDEAKDEFISMASHQLRTPLTSIKGYVSMLIEGDVGKISADQKQLLNEVFISSERMVRLIGDFLNVSRLQTGKFVIEKHPVDLALLVQRELDGLTQNATARGMKFIYKKPKNIPILNLDENKIQQVIMNFSDNAIYYSKDKAKITVTLKKVPGYVEFKVIDTGIGVPKAEQPHLFNKFFRATNARRARPDGTGVGLFLAKKVIDDHGGKILFESKEGKGSTFGFRLPLPKE